MMKQFAAIAVLSLLGLAVPAYASPETYTLSATLTTGSASGSVTYDPTTGAVSGGILSVYSQVDGGQATFTFLSYSAGSDTAYFEGPSAGVPPDEDYFDLVLTGTDASPAVSTTSSENPYFLGFFAGPTPDELTSGTLTPAVAATPEPSSLVLLGTGALGIASAARRRFLRA